MVVRKVKKRLSRTRASKNGKVKAKKRVPKGEWGGGRSMIEWLNENDNLSFGFAKRLIGRKKEGSITDQEVQWLQTYSLGQNQL